MTKILIVDDNENNRLTLNLLLEDIKNITLSEAVDGQEAVDICKKEKFDLIFMDIMMPVMDGIEATIAIKEIQPSVMIIGLSALDDKESKQSMLLGGVEDYLTKPIDSELFEQRVNNYISIISLKKASLFNKNAINPFSSKIYNRKHINFIDSEESIAQFWDFTLNNTNFACHDMFEHIRIIYGISKWLIKLKQEFTIEIEENDNNVFIMMVGIGAIKKQTIKNIVNKHLPNALFMVRNGTLYLELEKIICEIKEETQDENEDEVSNKTKSGKILSDESRNILTKTHYEAISAREFMDNTPLEIMPKLDNLEETESSIANHLITFENNPSKELIELVCLDLEEYCEVIQLLLEFEHLKFGITSLVEFLRTLDEEEFKSEKLKDFISHLLYLLTDMTGWRETVFVKQEAIDIHYLDASLLSSCLQLESTFEETGVDVDEGDDLEFF